MGSPDKSNGLLRRAAQHRLDADAGRVTREDVDTLAARHREVRRKIQGVPGRLRRLAHQGGLLFEMIKAYATRRYTQVPWWVIGTAVAAVAYFLAPIDLIPDFIPVIGQVDDAMLVSLAVVAIQEELRRYCEYMGYDPTRFAL